MPSQLVHGPYPPAAPIRLCLSTPPPGHAILLTPSRDALLRSLEHDPWLTTHAGTGTVAGMSSRVTLFYPRGPQHLIATLAALRTHDVASTSAPIAPRVTLDRAPSLLVLHELSAYFLPESGEHTISSYLLLVTHALSAIEFLSSNSSPASLVVFDTRLEHLKFPVLRTPPKSVPDEPDGPEDVPRAEPVLLFVKKYFEFSGTFQSHESDSQTPLFALHRMGEEESCS